MTKAHDLLVRFFDLLLGPLDRWVPTAGLWIVAALSGVVVLFVFRWTSNPAAIREARRRAQAELLAVRLYREEPSIVLRAQARFLAALGRYLGQILVPFAALLLPLGLLAAELDARYGSRALQPGERAVVEVFVANAVLESASLDGGDGVEIQSGPVRIAERGEMSWRILAKAPGRHRITLLVDGLRLDKEIVVAPAPQAAIARRMSAGWSSVLLAPGEAAIDPGYGVRRIEVRYPPLEIAVLGWKTSWLVVFLGASTTAALTLRRRMGVEF